MWDQGISTGRLFISSSPIGARGRLGSARLRTNTLPHRPTTFSPQLSARLTSLTLSTIYICASLLERVTTWSSTSSTFAMGQASWLQQIYCAISPKPISPAFLAHLASTIPMNGPGEELYTSIQSAIHEADRKYIPHKPVKMNSTPSLPRRIRRLLDSRARLFAKQRLT